MVKRKWVLLVVSIAFCTLSRSQDTLIKPVFPKCSPDINYDGRDDLSRDSAMFSSSRLDSIILGLYRKDDTLILIDHYKTMDFDCVIFPAKYKMDLPYVRFTPKRADIDKAENALSNQLYKLNKRSINQTEPHFIDKNLSKYLRQYAGYINAAGQRMLIISCFWPEDDGFPFSDWTKYWMGRVCDGGEGIWQVEFNLSTGKLIKLRIHGYA